MSSPGWGWGADSNPALLLYRGQGPCSEAGSQPLSDEVTACLTGCVPGTHEHVSLDSVWALGEGSWRQR